MNHIIHHRGQFAGYLRLNDVPVPALCGPSANEKWTEASGPGKPSGSGGFKLDGQRNRVQESHGASVRHFLGKRLYGKTGHGKNMDEYKARKADSRPANYRPCGSERKQ